MSIIFDIDGTLSDNEHRVAFLHRTPKDWDSFFAFQHLDQPINDTVDLLRTYYLRGRAILLATGRGEEHRSVTRLWLNVHNIPFTKLYMRAHGDRRDDPIVKFEMLAKMRADGFNPKIVFEDRARVCRMWREHGMRVYQVAEGDF
jgi:phosphoglycolate phosphatase-like HAD superfamily hydrolase